MAHPTCQRPDRHVPKLVCGYPLPCPHRTVVITAEPHSIPAPGAPHDNPRMADSGNYVGVDLTPTERQLQRLRQRVQRALDELDGYIDGAPDASEASKLANRVSLILSGEDRP